MGPPNPVVEVLLTVFKRREFIESCINSVLQQKRRDFLLTILDDGNCPEVARIVSSYKCPFVNHYVNSEQMGVAASVFGAIKRSRCGYISILNDDDFWHPDFLSELLDPLEQDPAITLSFCDHWIINEKGELLLNATEINSEKYGRTQLSGGLISEPAEFVIKQNIIPMAMGTIVRKSAIPETLLLPDVGPAYDYWLALVLSCRGNKAFYCPKRLSYYRLHAGMESVSMAWYNGEAIARAYAAALKRGLHRNHTALLAGRLLRLKVRKLRNKLLSST